MSAPDEATVGLAGRQAFAALLRSRIPNYPAHGSLQAFADRCGGKLTGPQIGQYARGEFIPRLENLPYLCKGMGIPPVYGFSVLMGLEPVEKAPPPDQLYELNEHINRAADLMNSLMVRSTNAEHPARRPRRNRADASNIDTTTEEPNSPIDPMMDYGYQALYESNKLPDESALVAA